MRLHAWMLMLAVALATASVPAGAQIGDAHPMLPAAPSFAASLHRALPYVVSVQGVSRTADRADAPRAHADDDFEVTLSRARMGAGIVLGDGGRIATAAHVVADADEIVVKLPDDRVLRAAVMARDDDADIALLWVGQRLRPDPPFGHSAALRPGDWVIAIGDPYGLERSVMPGVVSGARRHFAEDRELLFIQSSIAIGPGHSGGALVDAQGSIVGMNVRGVLGPYGPAGLGMAVPIEVVLQVTQELELGVVRRTRLGVRFDDVLPIEAFDAGLARANGAIVREVNPDGLGARLGLRVGDVVTGMNGQPIGDGADLARMLLAPQDERSLRFTVFRDGAYAELRRAAETSR